MLTLIFLFLGILFGWLALDAWRLRGGARLPYLELLKLRGQQASHLTLQEQTKRQDYDEKKLIGNTNAMFLVFVVASIACILGAILHLVAS